MLDRRGQIVEEMSVEPQRPEHPDVSEQFDMGVLDPLDEHRDAAPFEGADDLGADPGSGGVDEFELGRLQDHHLHAVQARDLVDDPVRGREEEGAVKTDDRHRPVAGAGVIVLGALLGRDSRGPGEVAQGEDRRHHHADSHGHDEVEGHGDELGDDEADGSAPTASKSMVGSEASGSERGISPIVVSGSSTSPAKTVTMVMPTSEPGIEAWIFGETTIHTTTMATATSEYGR